MLAQKHRAADEDIGGLLQLFRQPARLSSFRALRIKPRYPNLALRARFEEYLVGFLSSFSASSIAGRGASCASFRCRPVYSVHSAVGNGLFVVPVRNIGPGQNVSSPSIDVHARNRQHQSYQCSQYDNKLLHGI
jgi:hypothetical protein